MLVSDRAGSKKSFGMENPRHFEGDIVRSKPFKSQTTNKAAIQIDHRWPNGVVPIAIDPKAGFNQTQIDYIRMATRRIEDVSCIK